MEPEITVEPGASPPAAPTLDREELERAERDLADVEHALGRLDAGTYGTCEVCGVALDEAVLTARPAARVCATHG